VEPNWYIAEIVGAIMFPMGLVYRGRCLVSLACDSVNVWLYPSNGMVTLHRDKAKLVLKTLRDSQDKPVKWEGGE
jgi:hypothetical protein